MELGLIDQFTVCHVGRFNYPKNHNFIIDVFNQLLQIDPQAELLLVGNGDGLSAIKDKVNSFNIEKSVQFLGVRSDISELLMAADAYLFPSLYEGVSLATIEAQASGLPCFFSDRIPEECNVTDDVVFISLEKSPSYWAEQIYKSRQHQRSNNYEHIKNAGYDICNKAKWLEDFYLSRGGVIVE